MINNNRRKINGSYWFLAEKPADLGIGGGIEIEPTKWKSKPQTLSNLPAYISCPNCCEYCFDMQKILQADIEAAPKDVKAKLVKAIPCCGKCEGVRCHNSLCIEIKIV